MEELYRFLLHRSAEEIDLESQANDISDLATESSFQEDLKGKSTQDDRAGLALNFQTSSAFIGSLSGWQIGRGLLKVAHAYLGLDPTENVAVTSLQSDCAQLMATEFPGNNFDLSTPALAKSWLKDQIEAFDWYDDKDNLKDSILAIRESNQQVQIMPNLVAVLNAMKLIEQIAYTTETDSQPGRILQSSLYLSEVRPQEQRAELTELPDEDFAALEANRIEFEKINDAIEELLSVPRNQLEITDQEITGPLISPELAEGDDEVGSSGFQRQILLGSTTLGRLSSSVQSTLLEFEVPYQTYELVEVLDLLRARQKSLRHTTYKTLGKIIKGTLLGQVKLNKGQIQLLQYPTWLDTLVPQTTGNVSPAGIGDLMIVKQQLKRYEGGDVAHIENILQGEVKSREHRRHHLTEDTFVDETETTASQENETQTTSRFELRTEVQSQVQSESAFEAGLKLSASYGPTVKVEADTKFAQKNAKTEARKRATAMSKELVEKAVTKYTERHRSSATRRVLDEIEEINRHSLDATTATGHIVGVYQWINKVYESQVFNYGQRVMYEFMVPEPASWYIWSLNQAASQGESLAIPPAFNLSANDINEWNYADLAALYNAADVPAPPEPFITREINKSGGPNPEKGPMLGSDSIEIPDGYEYWNYVYHSWHSSKDDGDSSKGFHLSIPDAWHHPGPLPISYRGYSITGFTFYVHALCRRTHNAMEKWRMLVWEALQAGHALQVSEYQDKLAVLMTQAGVEIKGRNPYYNRKLERQELEKSCIALLSGTHPSWLGGIKETDIGPVPTNDVTKKHGAYVRFMEQAFEWENISYVLYPYFWARVKKWLELASIADVDPEFQEFLTAGYARVVVPVRPGFEPAVEHFRQTGQIWSGGKLPNITDPDYLPIAEEIKARQAAAGLEIPVGEPWEVRLPTQLVKLRPDNSLPEWEKQPDGTWTEIQNAP